MSLKEDKVKDKSKLKDKPKSKLKDKDKDEDKKRKSTIENITPSNEIHSERINNDEHSIIDTDLRNSNQQSEEKCNGCFIQTAVVYCTNCEKLYCKMCEDQIHIIPRMKTHTRVETAFIYKLKKLCFNHNLKLELYCETCEEPICNDCYELGPHNTKLHRVLLLNEGFSQKINMLKRQVQRELVSKYEIFTDQINFLEFNIDEIKKEKERIESEIHKEYLYMLDGLKNQEGKKLAELNYESAVLQRDINSINDIFEFVNEFHISNQPDMIEFLLRYKTIYDSLNEIISKNIKSEIKIDTFFSDSLKEKHEKLEKYEKAKEIVKSKDDIIWSLIKEKNDEEEKEFLIMKERATKEIREWKK